MFFDAAERISQVDKQLCDYIVQQYKPCMFVVNKWDLVVDQMPTAGWVDYLRDTFPTLWHVPIAFITGQTGKNVRTLLNHAQMLFKQSRARIGTSDLNRLVRRALGAASAAAAQEPASQDLLRHAGGRATAHDRADVQHRRRPSHRSTGATCWVCSATS